MSCSGANATASCAGVRRRKESCSDRCLDNVAARLCARDDRPLASHAPTASNNLADKSAAPQLALPSAAPECSDSTCCETEKRETSYGISPIAASGSTAEGLAVKSGLQDICCGASGQEADEQAGCGAKQGEETSRCGQNGRDTSEDVAGCARSRVAHRTAPKDVVSKSGSDGCCGSTGSATMPSKASDTCANTSARTSTDADSEARDSCCKAPTAELPEADSACAAHLQIAFDRFEALIRQGQCLCRKMIAEFNFCCCCGKDDTACVKRAGSVATEDSCCNPLEKADTGKCSSKRVARAPVPSAKEPVAACETTDPDVEHAAAREHVVVNVTGMTCTGCSRKMHNVLNDITGVSKPQVTFVSGTAQFEVDTTLAKADEVLLLIERRTGFKLSRVLGDHQHLDVLLDEEAAAAFEHRGLDGVVSFDKLTTMRTYRITYDPHLIGARSILPAGGELAPPADHSSEAQGRKHLVEMASATAISAVLTIPVVVLAWSDNPVPPQTRNSVSLALATLVQGIAVPTFYVGAIKSLIFSKVIEMDMLVVISITAAYFYSVAAFALSESGVELVQEAFFETSTLLITLVLLGRLMAAVARVRAISAVSLQFLQSRTALMVHEDQSTSEIDVRLLHFGDTVRIPAHSQIVSDGVVVAGSSEVDESMLTGESDAVGKGIGDAVIAGTINGPGHLDVRLTRLPGANSISDICGLVENALGAKPRVQDLADKIASWFIPAVIVIATVVLAIWIAVVFQVRNGTGGAAVGTAITYGIAVLAISCPCALGLAVPMVLVVAGGVAVRSGVVIKEADALERGHLMTDVLFDKTGTLTTGELQVVRESTYGGDDAPTDVPGLVRSLVSENTHPVSRAIRQHLDDAGVSANVKLDRTQSVPGCGIEMEWNGHLIRAGNPYWLSVSTQPAIQSTIEDGLTVFCVTIDGKLATVYGLKSNVRPEAAQVVRSLQARNIRCHIVSGDHVFAVRGIASAFAIDNDSIAARCTPAQKKDYVLKLQSEGRRVLFCGDGTNDAVAIAQANVGIQMGNASDVTKSVCSVTLLGGLDGIISFLDISKRAFTRITFNFIWSAVYNVFAILLAAGALQAVGFTIPPAYAGLGEIVSVTPVILAASSLAWSSRW